MKTPDVQNTKRYKRPPADTSRYSFVGISIGDIVGISGFLEMKIAAVTFKVYTNNNYDMRKLLQAEVKHFLPKRKNPERYRLRFFKYTRTPKSTIAMSIMTAAAHIVMEDKDGLGAFRTLMLYSWRYCTCASSSG